ncbi:MAG: hypothetical protein HY235_02780 [Acidobacteria bacterium]|nr:hypothetical protein [Acidobacteriota bacterium]
MPAVAPERARPRLTHPRWRGDGKEIFFLSPDGKMMSAGIKLARGAVEAGVPQPLFDANAIVAFRNRYTYDVTRDGQGFVILSPPESAAAEPIHILSGWQAGLKK